MRFGVVTLFPELMDAFLAVGVVGRAAANGTIDVLLENPRDHTNDVHRTVDDRPFGGGPGMVMKAEPMGAAIHSAKQAIPGAKTIYLSPQGTPLTQALLREWVELPGVILIAGRYEGIDERVVDAHIDEEISIGDYVLSGGEIAAMAVIDALARLVPGVLGHPQSAVEDSFGVDGLLDHPHYTRPERLGENTVPEVLLSGDHKAIARWRRNSALKRTWERRPDLLDKAKLSAEDEKLIKNLNEANGDIDSID